MKSNLKIAFGLLSITCLSSFTSFDSNRIIQRERIYTNELQNGDSLVIINSLSGCFLDNRFVLKIQMESNEFHVQYCETGMSDTIKKTLPFNFKKELVEFELMTIPNMSYGIGSNCNMIFQLNDELPDTISQCPQEKYYYNLINRIKN